MKYREIFYPTHHRAKQNGSVYEHILIAEKMLRRPLKDEEVIHHINKDKTDNSEINLMVFCSNNAHICYHHNNHLIPLGDGTYDCKTQRTKICKKCGKELKTLGSTICQKCNHLDQQKHNWNKQELERDIKELKSNVAIGKKYGVSDNTIKKWRKKLCTDSLEEKC